MAYTVTALLLFLRTTVIAWFFMISGIKFTTVTRISGRQNQVVDLKDLQTKADRCFNNFIDDPSQPKDLFIDYFDTLSAILSNVLNNGDNPYSKDSLIDDKYTALLMDVADRMVERIVDGKHYHSRFYDVLEISHYLVDDVTKYIKKGHYKIKDSLFCLWKLKFSASFNCE
ncbi:hypothetical protein H4219_005931 [Mycoemilia scoparia]|uniref:Uncharacterized protein n=1 Tax=Mycoemilia scoparia TaxID=417184 RepID=A0A9W8DP14_9FUNG|nr:hypothetical protein H4219_005931 [Mycoemilia scoparia]